MNSLPLRFATCILGQLAGFFLFAHARLQAQPVSYSPAYFGPNANPVPEFSDASIPEQTTLQLAGN
jgi:hypothetical protein